MVAVERYKKNEIRLGKAAELAGVTSNDMIDVLAEGAQLKKQSGSGRLSEEIREFAEGFRVSISVTRGGTLTPVVACA